MSNYAPNPEQEKVYDNLQNKTLGNVTADDIQKLTDPTFIQATNQDALITYNIVNKAAMRDGNIMPNTGGILTLTQTDGNIAVDIRPPNGQVYKIMGMSLRNSASPTGTNYYNTFLSTPESKASSDTPSQSNGDVFYSSVSSASTELLTETLFEEVFQPLFITNNMFMRIYSNFANVAASATVIYNVAYMRIR